MEIMVFAGSPNPREYKSTGGLKLIETIDLDIIKALVEIGIFTPAFLREFLDRAKKKLMCLFLCCPGQ